jgi:hypothetical protein
MIQLHPDYLMFELPNGESVPCSAETVTLELIGEAAGNLDPEVVKNAAAAVLHYFQQDLKRDCVSVGEFSEALEVVLRGFGFKVETASAPKPQTPIAEADLASLAQDAAGSGELFFFARLRDELRRKLAEPGASQLHLRGLRPCVKHLIGASRWSPRCEGLSDRIVDYVRDCLSRGEAATDCAVLIR